MEDRDGVGFSWHDMNQIPQIKFDDADELQFFSTIDFEELNAIQPTTAIQNWIQKINHTQDRLLASNAEFIPYSPKIMPSIGNAVKTQGISPFQCAFYSPPMLFQDPSLKFLTSDQFLSFSWAWFHWLKPSIRETGFLIVHAIEATYPKLRIILDHLFGRENHIATLIWKKSASISRESPRSGNYGTYFDAEFDYIIIYSKNISKMTFYKLPPDLSTYKNPDDDPRGPWHSMPLVASQKSSNKTFTYTFLNGNRVTKKFRYPPHSIQQLEMENRLHYTNPPGRLGIPRVKKFYRERMAEYQKTGKRGFTPNSLWIDPKKYGSIQEYWNALSYSPFESTQVFPFRVPKLYQNLVEMTTRASDRIFDGLSFFHDIPQMITAMRRKFYGISWNSRN